MRSGPLRAAPAVLAIAVVACGASTPTAATSPSAGTALPSAQSSPGAKGHLYVFAVASGLPGAQLVGMNVVSTHATVAIVDASGKVLAQASFTPPPAPNVGNAVPLLQSPVRVAAGAVFYADSTGVVHRLKPDGAIAVAATFPLTNGQQELSYAVSPDGLHLIATVLSTPPLHDPPPQRLGDPIYQDGGHWSLDFETADAGGATVVVLHKDLGTGYPMPTEIVGWDGKGPLATLSTYLGAQQALPSARFYGTLIHIAMDGTHLDAIGGPDCTAVDELFDGTVLCASDWFHPSVRTSAGTVLWSPALTGDVYAGQWLSPDGTEIAVQNVVIRTSGAASAARGQTAGGGDMIALGWLDSNTVIGADANSGKLYLYEARHLSVTQELGVTGVYEGLLGVS